MSGAPHSHTVYKQTHQQERNLLGGSKRASQNVVIFHCDFELSQIIVKLEPCVGHLQTRRWHYATGGACEAAGPPVTHVLGFPQRGRGAGAQLPHEVLREGAARKVTAHHYERHFCKHRRPTDLLLCAESATETSHEFGRSRLLPVGTFKIRTVANTDDSTWALFCAFVLKCDATSDVFDIFVLEHYWVILGLGPTELRLSVAAQFYCESRAGCNPSR